MTRALADIRAQQNVAVLYLTALAGLNTAMSDLVVQLASDARGNWERTAEHAALHAVESARGSSATATPEAVQLATEAVSRTAAALIDSAQSWMTDCGQLAAALHAEIDALDAESAPFWRITVDQLKAPNGNQQ